MPASIFSDSELARLASFPEEIPGDDLIRAFTLTGADRDLVAIRRGAANRLRLALQLCALRYLGFVPRNLSAAPRSAACFVADQLEHTTDTAGYTEIVFARFHLLGLQFAPRIRDLGAQRLYRLDAPPRKEGVAVLLKGLVRSKTLLDNWDELLRVAGSLKLGWVTASLLISKLQTGARENVLSRALRDLGCLVKTQFILRWIENPDYRRPIHPQLNKREALHALRRFLFFAHQGKVQRRQADQQTSGPLPKLGHECHRHLERRHRTAAGRGEDRPRHRSRPSVACPLRARQSLR